MLSGRDIVCISSVDWDFHWQIHHELMSTLAAQGNRVLYIENTGVRPPGVSDITRVRQRLGPGRHLIVLLAGIASATVPGAPQLEVRIWEESIASIGDPYVGVEPLRVAR